jgi:DNA-nicking Smr family endonuclease
MRRNIWNRWWRDGALKATPSEMKKPKAPAAAADVDLFFERVQDVTPLPDHGRVVHARPAIRPIAVQHLRDESEALADSMSDAIAWDIGVETGNELVYLRNGISRLTVKKLRRGHWIIQDELDLHGFTSVEARAQLVEFLNSCKRRDMRCVRIIHGKGLRSKNREPVLKSKVANWLMRRDEVLAYCQAREVDGGSGAVLVLLRTGR